jgi:hypothetical protein
MTLNPMNQRRLSPTSPMQSCPRLLDAPFHHREYLNSASPRTATAAPQRQPPQIRCLLEPRAPKNPGLPSLHPGWVIAQGLLHTLSATAPKLVWLRPAPAPAEQSAAVAPAAKTAILVKLTRARLDLSGTEGISSTT